MRFRDSTSVKVLHFCGTCLDNSRENSSNDLIEKFTRALSGFGERTYHFDEIVRYEFI